MPIIKQLNATKFRSLKYGNDTSDGGSSRQPYMRVELKDLDKPINRLRLTKFDDGLVRGGAVGALNAAAVDTLRIGKFFKDLPKGPLFLIKQVGLQLSNPKLEFKKDAGTLGGIGPTRLYNLGINTLAQVPLNAFGGHLVRHGLLPVMNDNTKYLSVVTENNKLSENNLDSQNNRLVGLRDKFNLGDGETELSLNLQEAIENNRQENIRGREANRRANKIGRTINRLNNKEGREFNRSINKYGREANREANRQGREANREFNRTGRQNNREANRTGRQNNRLVNQSTREGAKTEGFEFTRSKFKRSTFERASFERSKYERSTFERSVFHRTRFKKTKINISDYTVDNYLGGPGSVYGIGRTIINRYNFTEDKIKIDQAFENARIETVRGSLLVNPLTEPSNFENTDGSYTTGAITVPFISLEQWDADNKEEDQFKVLSRKKQPESFYYNGDIAESKLQTAVGDGNIDVEPHPFTWTSNKMFGSNHTPQINPSVETPNDKFKVIKTALDFDTNTQQLKYKDENPTYIGGQRIISVKQAGGEEINNTLQDATTTSGVQIIKTTAKTQEEADKKALSDYSNPGTQLNTVVVGRDTKRVNKTVKASIVDVSKKENALEKIYNAGEMASDPKVRVVHNNFVTKKINVNRDPINPFTQERTAYYLNGSKKVDKFDRIDSDIMVVEFDPIDPFSAKEYGNVQFSAYMSGFKYNANSTWNPVKYVGRSESFYTFTEHKRDVSFNLQIPCFNKTHLLEKHRALSELQSIGAGSYNTSNRLGGVITQVTVGRYLIKEPGILTSVSFDIPDTSSWDIDLELAMYINAQFSFIIIGNELPQYQVGGFLNDYLPDVEGGYLRGANAR